MSFQDLKVWSSEVIDLSNDWDEMRNITNSHLGLNQWGLKPCCALTESMSRAN